MIERFLCHCGHETEKERNMKGLSLYIPYMGRPAVTHLLCMDFTSKIIVPLISIVSWRPSFQYIQSIIHTIDVPSTKVNYLESYCFSLLLLHGYGNWQGLTDPKKAIKSKREVLKE